MIIFIIHALLLYFLLKQLVQPGFKGERGDQGLPGKIMNY